jgi:hypothetical protein
MMSLEAQAGGRPLALRSLFCTEPVATAVLIAPEGICRKI